MARIIFIILILSCFTMILLYLLNACIYIERKIAGRENVEDVTADRISRICRLLSCTRAKPNLERNVCSEKSRHWV